MDLAWGVWYRFRELAPVDDDKPVWELGNKADGIVPLEADTELADNINHHRYAEVHAMIWDTQPRVA